MSKTIDLEARQEFIFKVGIEDSLKLELRRGLAEVCGTEMLANKTYTFSKGTKASVFTYHGATLEMTGTPLKSHVSKNCDYMTSYLSIHRDLEKMRDEAEVSSEQMKFSSTPTATTNNNDPKSPASTKSPEQEATAGEPNPTAGDADLADVLPDISKTPICLICEPLDARNIGKSTLCRILLNYATRRGRAPIFVDLDPDQGHIGLPGSIGALSIESPIDIETGFQLRSSMLMHFGHTSPSADTEGKSGLYYSAIVDNMAKIVHSKLEQDKKSYHSGVIINSSSWTDSSDYKILLEACKSFKANMVVVVDDEVLQDDLQKDLTCEGQPPVKVINVSKTVDIHKTRAQEYMNLRYSKIKEYFYGSELESYNPMTSEVKFSFLKRLIYRIGNPLMLPASLMPLGRKEQDNQIKVSPYDCTASDLLHHILAISYCRIDDAIANPEQVLRMNIMGFICITSLRNDGEIVSVLTPQKLPNPMDHVLLYSEVQHMDSLI